MSKSLQEIIREVCVLTSNELNEIQISCINFQFGDSVYINGQLHLMGEAQMDRFPLIGMYPFEEKRGALGYQCETSLDFIIACQTVSGYDNWERHDVSFVGFLRPIYDTFLKQLKLCKLLDFGSTEEIEHTYKENYAYGSRGVMDSEKRELPELIDAIEIKNLKVKLLKENCYGTSERLW